MFFQDFYSNFNKFVRIIEKPVQNPMNFYQKWCIKKAKIKLGQLEKYYLQNQSILDIGSGNCGLNYLIKKSGRNITAVDIANKSAFDEVKPVVYDGITLPFEDNSFDLVQLITVLHHTPNPESIVKEAKRVGKKVIIMEEIYESGFQKQLTFFADSLNNWEFKGHPHTNKTDKEWKALFKQNNLNLIKSSYNKFLVFFKQVIYVLEK